MERVAALPGVESGRAGEQDAAEPRPAPDDVSPAAASEQWHEVDVNTVSPDGIFR